MTRAATLDERAGRELRVVQDAARRTRPPVPPAPAVAFQPIGDLVRDVRPVPWLVKRHLERGTTVCVFGEPESGKSLLLLDLALHVAAGLDWNGNKVTPGSVFYLGAEGREGLKRRARAWSIRHHVALDGLPMFAHTLSSDLGDQTAAHAIGEAVAALAVDCRSEPQLIVVDTLSRYLGGDENSTADMAQFVANLDALVREPTGACVALAHHVGHVDKSRARGSTVLRGAVDTEYRVVRDSDTGIVTVDCTKAKDWVRPPAMHFRIHAVELGIEDDDGEPVTSVILDRTDAPTATAAEPLGANQRQALAALRRLYAEHRGRIEAGGGDPDAALVLIEDWRKAACPDRRRWPEVRAALLAHGLIAIEHPYVRLSE